MAGYIVSLDNEESLKKCIKYGIYSTNLSKTRNNLWSMHHEGTFADYFGMKQGDNIYFFIKRKIYGIGKIINVGLDCKYWNYTGAQKPLNYEYNDIKDTMIFSEGTNENNRCFCTFEPSPKYFIDGIDMDDVLQSNPSKFRMLRAFWKLSFVKIDDEENLALRDVILKRNEDILYDDNSTSFEYDKKLQQEVLSNINEDYLMNSQSLLEYSSLEDKIKHEMAIEASLMEYITKDYYDIFGKWDYISHQVVASPFKPVDYMDKMDLFGYRYIKGYKTISKYLVIEIKKDKAKKDVIDQIMKYVDWVNEEYAYGDYGMIEACIVAADFENDVINYKKSVCVRNYTRGRRPTMAAIWKNLKLIKYSYRDGKLTFEEIV